MMKLKEAPFEVGDRATSDYYQRTGTTGWEGVVVGVKQGDCQTGWLVVLENNVCKCCGRGGERTAWIDSDWFEKVEVSDE